MLASGWTGHSFEERQRQHKRAGFTETERDRSPAISSTPSALCFSLVHVARRPSASEKQSHSDESPTCFLSSHTSSQALGERTVCTMPARRACVRHPKGDPQPGL